MELEASLQPGQIDVSPSSNVRSVGLNAGLGQLTMSGAGHVDVARSVRRYTERTGIGENYERQFAP